MATLAGLVIRLAGPPFDGSTVIEIIYIGAFAEAGNWKEEEQELMKIENVVKLARNLDLGVNAGHGP